MDGANRRRFEQAYRSGRRDRALGTERRLCTTRGGREPALVKQDDTIEYHGYKHGIEDPTDNVERAWMEFKTKHRRMPAMVANAGMSPNDQWTSHAAGDVIEFWEFPHNRQTHSLLNREDYVHALKFLIRSGKIGTKKLDIEMRRMFGREYDPLKMEKIVFEMERDYGLIETVQEGRSWVIRVVKPPRFDNAVPGRAYTWNPSWSFGLDVKAEHTPNASLDRAEWIARRASDSEYVAVDERTAASIAESAAETERDVGEWLALWYVPPEYQRAGESLFRVEHHWLRPVWTWESGLRITGPYTFESVVRHEENGSMDRSAVAFFKKHAGGIVGKEHEYAKQLASAEAEAQRRGWTVEWSHDPSPDVSWMDEEQLEDYEAGGTEMLEAVLRDEDGNALASLGGIAMDARGVGRNPYGRVVEAELALEALAEE